MMAEDDYDLAGLLPVGIVDEARSLSNPDLRGRGMSSMPCPPFRLFTLGLVSDPQEIFGIDNLDPLVVEAFAELGPPWARPPVARPPRSSVRYAESCLSRR